MRTQCQPNNVSTNYSERIYEFKNDPEELRAMYYHLQWLNDEALHILSEKQAPREFFHKCEKPKTRLVLNLKAKRMPDAEITRIVSVAITILLQEFEETGTVYNYKDLSRFFDDDEISEGVGKVKATLFKYKPPALFAVAIPRPVVVLESSEKRTGSLKRRAWI